MKEIPLPGDDLPYLAMRVLLVIKRKGIVARGEKKRGKKEENREGPRASQPAGKSASAPVAVYCSIGVCDGAAAVMTRCFFLISIRFRT